MHITSVLSPCTFGIFSVDEGCMGIGICCQWLGSRVTARNARSAAKTITENIIDEKNLQLGRFNSGSYTDSKITSTYINNIIEVSKVLDLIHSTTHVRHFRVSSNLLPLMDRVDRGLWDNDSVREELAKLGRKVSALQFRISTHPGQFTVLSSDREDVVASSIREIENHNWIFDAMGLDSSTQFSINIHGGKAGRGERLIESINTMSSGARRRLTLENDESSYSIRDLLAVAEKTGVPIVFDSHHHTFNPDGMTGKDAAKEALLTWAPGITAIQHLSNTEPGLVNGSFTERRKHSYDLHYIPDYQLEMLNDGLVDVEMEFKGKNLGVLPNLTRLGVKGYDVDH